EEVKLAVAIIVQPGAAGSPMGSVRADTGLLCDIGEGAVTVIVVQHVLAPIGDKQVLKAVVVVIAHANAGRPTRAEQTGLGGHIGKSAVTIILVEAVGSSFGGGLESCPAEEENVEPAVVIVIEQGASAAHCLHDVFLLGDAAIDRWKMQPRRFRNVRKLGVKRKAGGFTSRRRLHASRGHS